MRVVKTGAKACALFIAKGEALPNSVEKWGANFSLSASLWTLSQVPEPDLAAKWVHLYKDFEGRAVRDLYITIPISDVAYYIETKNEWGEVAP